MTLSDHELKVLHAMEGEFSGSPRAQIARIRLALSPRARIARIRVALQDYGWTIALLLVAIAITGLLAAFSSATVAAPLAALVAGTAGYELRESRAASRSRNHVRFR